MAEEAISAILIREEVKMQHPIYYISRALTGPESQYTAAEKLVLSLVHAAH